MPTIKITDELSAPVDVTLAPTSTLLKYAKELPGMVLHGADLSRLRFLTLSDPAVQSLQAGLAFARPIELGANGPELTLRADAGLSFEVVTGSLFPADHFGENIAIPDGQCYFAVGFHAGTGAGVSATSGALTFGIDAGTEVSVASYRPFANKPEDAPTFFEAIKTSLGELVLPADADDLRAMPAACVVTVGGHGTLKFSGSANLLAVANPLATLALPGPLPALSIQQSASVNVGASWEVSTDYQIRAQKLDARRVRLGWYRKHASEVTVTASAKVGISASFGDTDLFPTLIGAISSDAHADLEELKKAGVSADQATAIASAVKAAVDRKLQVSVAAEFGSLESDQAAFLYEIDMTALDATAADAVRRSLRGDLGGFTAGALPAGVTEVRSILTHANASRFKLKLNLLGIFNFASVSKLALQGVVTFTPSTGELVISDKATADRFRSTAVNFGADEDKLRHVMAESFLITAAYRGSQAVIAPPQLSSSHVFYRMDHDASRDDLRRHAAIAQALGLTPAELPAAVSKFGKTSVVAEASYDDALSRGLFLDADGQPRPRADYEAAGLRGVAMLVLPDGDDAFRRIPALQPEIWSRMKDLGPNELRQIFPNQLQAAVVSADYLAIQWWADTMTATGEILSRMAARGADPHDPRFQQLRQELADHLREVAARAHEQFGQPWGLVSMFQLSRKSAAEVQITSPRFVYTASRALATGAGASGTPSA